MNNMTIPIMGDKPYTIIAIDIFTGTYELLRTDANAAMSEFDRVGLVETLFKYLINDVVNDKYKETVLEFIDMTGWSARLAVHSSYAVVYMDKSDNWRRAWIVPSHLNDDGSVASVIMCVRDITEDQEQESRKNEEIKAARTDQLTGLGNRTVFYEVIKEIEMGVNNRPKEFGVAFVDINGLKTRNDESGHDAGDQLILEVADIVAKIFDREYIFRHGGDEFMLISFDENENRFNDKIDRLAASWNEGASAAVGAVWVDDISNIEDAIIRADRRMYLEKNQFYRDKKNDRRDYDLHVRMDVGLNYVPFEGLVFGNENRYYYVTNLTTGMTRWSPNTLDTFDIESEYLIQAEKQWLRLVHPNDREEVQEDIRKIISGEHRLHNMDYRIMNREGKYVTCTCKGQVIANPNGDGYLFLGAVENHEVTKTFDSVTGLPNVFSFINDTIAHLRLGSNDCLLAIGINDMDTINRTYGYEVGNEILRMFADKLRTFWVDESLAYRLDGTKFCLAVRHATVQDMRNVFWALKKTSRQGFVVKGARISFNICGGLVCVDKSVDTNEQAVQASLMHVLHYSKHRKHSEFVLFNESSDAEKRRNLELLDALRRSVYDDMSGFYLCYQPIIDAESGRITGAEALLRWNKEPFGEVSPGVFIPMLESDPCFFELGNWVLKTALRDFSKYVETNPEFIVNVNVSAEQIERDGFREAVGLILDETGFPAWNLCFELTERVISLDLGYLRGELEYFKSMGIKIALDDFGTGASSIGLLIELPVDEVKIDRQFVNNITHDVIQQSIVESIALCADRVGLTICVEGIETEKMKDFLSRYNISRYQGFYYSKPVVYDSFTKLKL